MSSGNQYTTHGRRRTFRRWGKPKVAPPPVIKTKHEEKSPK